MAQKCKMWGFIWEGTTEKWREKCSRGFNFFAYPTFQFLELFRKAVRNTSITYIMMSVYFNFFDSYSKWNYFSSQNFFLYLLLIDLPIKVISLRKMEFKMKLTLTLILASAMIKLSKFDIRNQNEGSFDKPLTRWGPSIRYWKSSLADPLSLLGNRMSHLKY